MDKMGLGKGGDALNTVAKEMQKLTKYNSRSLMLWGAFLTVTLLVWMFGSSGDFSFLLTFAALWRCFGFGLLNYKVWSGMNVRSVSMKTLVLYSTCFTFRLLSIMRHQGEYFACDVFSPTGKCDMLWTLTYSNSGFLRVAHVFLLHGGPEKSFTPYFFRLSAL